MTPKHWKWWRKWQKTWAAFLNALPYGD